MNRIDIIQKIIDTKKAKTYLEIGVAEGKCLLKIKAQRKIGVDIKFDLLSDWKHFLVSHVTNLTNVFNKYYEMKSDDFFTEKYNLFKKKKIDVALIDGLHEYKQVIRDVDNCLNFLSEDGVIVLHDCNPSSALAETPLSFLESAKRQPQWTEAWSGDVWKAIVYLRSQQNDLNIVVLDCDWGIGIITRGLAKEKLNLSLEDIKNLSYKDLDNNREEFLNLKKVEYLGEWFKNNP